VQVDGELVAFDGNGIPDFHRLGARMLHGDTTIAVTMFVFDLLAVEGLPTTMLPMSSGGRCSRSSTSRVRT
jgi:ATP-dependent DNA ligase